MTREEEKEHYSYLYKNKYDGLEECYQPTLESAYEAGWEAADEHPISGEQIAAMKNEIKFLKRKLVECDKMYRELQNKNPWVSVDERLPEIVDKKEEITEDVLVCIKSGVFLIAHYSYFYKAWYAFNENSGCLWRKIRTPKYWMPMPQTPKGGEK